MHKLKKKKKQCFELPGLEENENRPWWLFHIFDILWQNKLFWRKVGNGAFEQPLIFKVEKISNNNKV